jgi:hypothetical protein
MGLGLAMGLTAKLGLLGRLLKLMIRAIFAVLFLFGWGLATLSVHVVVAPADVEAPGGFGRDSDASEAERDWRVLVVPKDRLTFSATYVDLRTWGPQEVSEHPEFVVRLIEAGHADAIAHAMESSLLNRLINSAELRSQWLDD